MLQVKACSNYNFWDFRAFEKGRQHKESPMKIFDWNKAAKFIRDNSPEIAAMSLNGDYDQSYRKIYEKRKIVTHLKNVGLICGSRWAIPVLEADGKVYECYLDADQTKYKQKTYWPKEAVEILEGRHIEIFN